MKPQTSENIHGVVIALLVFALLLSCLAIVWEAQIISRQQVVIRMLTGGGQ